ncbi:ribose-5-phosphate isomerase-like [Tropilaelaps mercedesae]|uniref:ribose-5-phosphate isomerase n=1 Tax=Tropilaelaps mercedesae TaxID=418985 RepID=A0A1V9XMM0_9ACAR|nr:ribose-5-phosphate isomerase-like [Tropilaelaps mercedesae]
MSHWLCALARSVPPTRRRSDSPYPAPSGEEVGRGSGPRIPVAGEKSAENGRSSVNARSIAESVGEHSSSSYSSLRYGQDEAGASDADGGWPLRGRRGAGPQENSPGAVLVLRKSNFAVGIGSGSTVVYAAERLAQHIASGYLTNITCVPTSFQSLQLIRKHKLTLTDLDETPELDVTIDGADEADVHLTCIKGGGGCQAQEKIVAASSKVFVVVADFRKDSIRLGQQWKKGIPVEVLPMAYTPVTNKIEKILGLKPVLRTAVNKAGPVVTDNGNFILDCPFPEDKAMDWPTIAVNIKMIPGVVETGLFVGMTQIAYYGQEDGYVKTVRPK